MRLKKQISFDLNTKALQEYFPEEKWRKAYDVIKKYMLNNGFLWKQGSVYISEKTMSTTAISNLLKNLVDKNPWLHKCMKDCIVSNITKQYSQNHLFDKGIDIPKRKDLNIGIEVNIKI